MKRCARGTQGHWWQNLSNSVQNPEFEFQDRRNQPLCHPSSASTGRATATLLRERCAPLFWHERPGEQVRSWIEQPRSAARDQIFFQSEQSQPRSFARRSISLL